MRKQISIFQEAELEVPIPLPNEKKHIFETYVREDPHTIWLEIWSSISTLEYRSIPIEQ